MDYRPNPRSTAVLKKIEDEQLCAVQNTRTMFEPGQFQRLQDEEQKEISKCVDQEASSVSTDDAHIKHLFDSWKVYQPESGTIRRAHAMAHQSQYLYNAFHYRLLEAQHKAKMEEAQRVQMEEAQRFQQQQLQHIQQQQSYQVHLQVRQQQALLQGDKIIFHCPQDSRCLGVYPHGCRPVLIAPDNVPIILPTDFHNQAQTQYQIPSQIPSQIPHQTQCQTQHQTQSQAQCQPQYQTQYQAQYQPQYQAQYQPQQQLQAPKRSSSQRGRGRARLKRAKDSSKEIDGKGSEPDNAVD